MPQKLGINYVCLRSKVIAKVSYKNRIKSIDIFLVFSFLTFNAKYILYFPNIYFVDFGQWFMALLLISTT